MEIARSVTDSYIQSLALGNMKALDELYIRFRDDFMNWAGQRFHVKNREDLIDAWHDTMIMFYEQVRDKKLTHLTCEIKTYLFTIGYRRLIKMHKRNEKFDLVDEIDANINIDESINVLELEEIHEQNEKILLAAIEEIPDKTRQILMLRYMGRKSIPEIMAAMKYESENSVSVTLSRGLKQLKKLITERMPTKK